jgi:hypothetical protein
LDYQGGNVAQLKILSSRSTELGTIMKSLGSSVLTLKFAQQIGRSVGGASLRPVRGEMFIDNCPKKNCIAPEERMYPAEAQRFAPNGARNKISNGRGL